MSRAFDFPTDLITVADYEKQAFKKIAKNALDYYRSGAGDELTLKLNQSCFDRYIH
jgi:(S)-2-hydroxy-acid oxidase